MALQPCVAAEERSLRDMGYDDSSCSSSAPLSSAAIRGAAAKRPFDVEVLLVAARLPPLEGGGQLHRAEFPQAQHQQQDPGVKKANGATASELGAGKRRPSLRRTGVRTRFAALSSADALAQFADWCEEKHEDMLATWRKLDVDASLSLSKAEFTKGLMQLSYKGDIKKLWAILDRDRTDTISFHHFLPEFALDLARLKRWAEVKFGSIVGLFHAIDTDRNGKLEFPEFMAGCQKEGIPDDLKSSLRTLFKFIDTESVPRTRGALVEVELQFLQRWQCPAYLWAKPDERALENFRRAVLAGSMGNPLVAWRKVFDKAGSMRVNYLEFAALCRRLAEKGMAEAAPKAGMPALYCTLDTCRSGWISLRHWDEHAYRLLSGFTRWARETFRCASKCVAAWEKTKGKGVDLRAFSRGIEPLGYSEEDCNLLFVGLSFEPVAFDEDAEKFRGGKISLEEIVFLDTWEFKRHLEEELAWEEIARPRVLGQSFAN